MRNIHILRVRIKKVTCVMHIYFILKRKSPKASTCFSLMENYSINLNIMKKYADYYNLCTN